MVRPTGGDAVVPSIIHWMRPMRKPLEELGLISWRYGLEVKADPSSIDILSTIHWRCLDDGR